MQRWTEQTQPRPQELTCSGGWIGSEVLTSGILTWHSIKQTQQPAIGKSAKLLAWSGLSHSLRIDAGLQINLHKMGPILPEQQINSSFYRLSNQPYSPSNLTANGADDLLSARSHQQLLFLPLDLSISFHLLSHEPSSETLISSLVNTVLIELPSISSVLGLEGLPSPPSHLWRTLNSRHQCTSSFWGPWPGHGYGQSIFYKGVKVAIKDAWGDVLGGACRRRSGWH